VPTGIAPSGIAVAHVNGDGLPAIIVSDQASGDVTVLLNDPAHSFSKTLRYRAGTGLYGLEVSPGSAAISSVAQSVGLVAGDFTGHGRNDLAVINQGSDSVTILAANGNGGFANPQRGLTTSSSDGLSINQRPIAIVAGDFNRDGLLDLAVLMEDTGQLWIFSGNGDGTFHHTFSIPVGEDATGLTVFPVGSNGLLNLLVGNGFGDVLTLVGKGDGTFQIQGSRVSLSVVPNLLGPGQAGVLVGDQQNNRVTVQALSAGGNQYAPVETLGSSTSSDQMAPGDVQWDFLDRGSTLPDAVVLSTGSNAVVVYRTTSVTNGVPNFALDPRTYFVGTAPASITVADITGNGIPDMLIANQGSNDVSVIFGTYDANGDWVGIPGPRLKSGGDGPIAVIVRDLNDDHVPDLAVVNGGSGIVTELPGVGGGFFDDRQPELLFNLGSSVVQPPTLAGDSGVGFAVTAAGDLVRFDLNHPGDGASLVFSGQHVLAAQALPSGQVLVALADGVVDNLVPVGNGLSVASELLPTGGTPALPSAIEVLAKPNGLFDVLVSSQGSDTLFVFSLSATPSEPVTPSGGGLSPPTINSFQAPSATSTQVTLVAVNANVSTTSVSALGTGNSTSSNSGLSSATTSSAVGISLGTFSSFGTGPARGTGEALLVSVEGNTYLSVPILGLGSEDEEEAGRGEGRRPELSTLHPFGDTSPITRFVIGIDEAVEDYHGSEEGPLLRHPDAAQDPWNEDLFFRHLPVQPPLPGQAQDSPLEGGRPEAMLPDVRQKPPGNDRWTHAYFDDEYFDDLAVRPLSPTARIVARLMALAGLLAPLLLKPAISGDMPRKSGKPGNSFPRNRRAMIPSEPN
jgi:hypothetical protein